MKPFNKTELSMMIKRKVKNGMTYKDAYSEVEKMKNEVIKNRSKKDKDSLGI